MGRHFSSDLDDFSLFFLKSQKNPVKSQKFFDSFPNPSPYFDKERPGKLSKEKRGVNSLSAVHTSSGKFSGAFGPHFTKGGPGGSKGTAQHFTTSGLNRKRKFTRYIYYIFFIGKTFY